MQILKIQLNPIQEPAVVHVSLRRLLLVFTVKLGMWFLIFLKKKISQFVARGKLALSIISYMK